jgi:thymidine kinase
MPDPLPPFSGDEPTCTKCGHIGASTLYLAHGECIHDPGPEISIGYEANERLHRECRRCDYAWDEALNPTKEQS